MNELGICDRELALEVVVAAELVQPVVRFRADAGDEEARDRRDAASIAAPIDEPLEPADVGLCDLA
jgi:hypothetical protein